MGLDFGIPGGDLIARMLPWVIGATVAFIALFLTLKIWRAFFSRKVQSIGVETGMRFQDIDSLRRKGLISEEEYKKIRRSLASQESERDTDEREAERTQALMREVAVNPDAARKFLTPEQLAEAQGSSRPAPPAASGAPPDEPYPPAAVPASMNNPRVVRARNEYRAQTAAGAGAPAAASSAPNSATPAPAGKPRDIDVLLAKGAITQEEYDRLRQFFD